ncbi:unnamed protein product [Laminaria digitata]
MVPFEASVGLSSSSFPTGTNQDAMNIVAVPEPSSAFMLGLGALGILARRSRTK